MPMRNRVVPNPSELLAAGSGSPQAEGDARVPLQSRDRIAFVSFFSCCEIDAVFGSGWVMPMGQ